MIRVRLWTLRFQLSGELCRRSVKEASGLEFGDEDLRVGHLAAFPAQTLRKAQKASCKGKHVLSCLITFPVLYSRRAFRSTFLAVTLVPGLASRYSLSRVST